ncbi:hypothetical protein PsorP6_010482 [Peronosclerospora sorghi]|uniref:Uncharacterized protein n=1 Tax=Peronosclerospora sorghi TaxID=230839 RepID=A0ACC0VWJ6_9STRA|nr:hypothetical protein PsorP6_010482 [Peronosclerospora sorghi]
MSRLVQCVPRTGRARLLRARPPRRRLPFVSFPFPPLGAAGSRPASFQRPVPCPNDASVRRTRHWMSTLVDEATAAHERVTWPSNLAKRVERRIVTFPRNLEVKQLVVEAGMNPLEWERASSRFRTSFLEEPATYFKDQTELEAFGKDLDHVKRSSSFIFYPYFLDYAKTHQYLRSRDVDARMVSLQQLTDLRLPHQLYPFAAAMQRKIIYHVGPTNSGKTYQALARLKQAGDDGGIYCGPLRLLALEIFDRLNADGVYTSLVTGQEKKVVPYATHVACTVEMANIARPWDVAVIDEIQLIGDPQRGWAWTRAFFGLQAKELHICGSSDAVHLIEKFAATTGDTFELRSYERRSPLRVSTRPLRSLRHVEPGDCVVAFSRRAIFELKRSIEMATGAKCCIIYGQLPPETRSQQARLFNARDNDYNILVASDAIGMGLNLNIKRVVFATVEKYSGQRGGMVTISPSLVKQIAGRAGRSNSAFASGEATCLTHADLNYVRTAYEEACVPLPSAGLFPSSEQMEDFASQFPGVSDLADLVDKYVMLARLDGDYFMCNAEDMKDAATLLRETHLALSDRFTFCMSPVNLRSALARRVFLDYARAHAVGERVKLDIYLPKYPPRTPDALGDVEVKAKIIDLYLWLSYRFEATFVERELALELKTRVLELVEQGLINTTYHRQERKTRWTSGAANGLVRGEKRTSGPKRQPWRSDTSGRPHEAKREARQSVEDETKSHETETSHGVRAWMARLFGR